jgi:hypothetical protein
MCVFNVVKYDGHRAKLADSVDYISVKEWAELHGVAVRTARSERLFYQYVSYGSGLVQGPVRQIQN